MGSTAVVANASGAKVGEVRYKAWGEERPACANPPCGTIPTTYRYTGQRWESGIGLYFYNARWYDPALGRFVQPDILALTIEKPQGLNRFTYAANNPLRYADPSGYLSDDEITAWSGFDATWLKEHHPEIYYMLLALVLGDVLVVQTEGFTLWGVADIAEVNGNARLVFLGGILGGPSGLFQVAYLTDHPIKSLRLERSRRCGGLYEVYSWEEGQRADIAYQTYSKHGPVEHHHRTQWWESALASLTISVPSVFLDPIVGLASEGAGILFFGSPWGPPSVSWGDWEMRYDYGDWELRVVVRGSDVILRQWVYEGYKGLSGKVPRRIPTCKP